MQSDHSLIVSLAIIFILVTFYRPLAVEQRNTKRLKQFRLLLKDLSLSADQYDFFNNRIAAIDYSQAKLVFVDFSLPSRKYQVIAIDEIDYCSVDKNDPDGNTIALNCFLHNQSVISLPFFNAGTDLLADRSSLQQKAAYWQRKISLHIDFINKSALGSLSL